MACVSFVGTRSGFQQRFARPRWINRNIDGRVLNFHYGFFFWTLSPTSPITCFRSLHTAARVSYVWLRKT